MVTLMVFLSFVVHFALPAKAESVNMKVSVEAGFDGKVKRGKGFPLSIQLENNGEAFKGDLLIQFNPSYNTGGSLSVHVDVPEGSSKTYQVAVPGVIEDSPAFHQNQPIIHLYKGDWASGEKVQFQGDKTFKPRYIDPSERIIGVLSENYDRLKELRVLPSRSYQMLPLTKEQLPKQGLGLEMVDYLVIDEYAISQLDKQQQLAIKEWIQSGGVLVAGAAPDASGSYGELYSILPMKLEKESLGATSFLLTAKNDHIDFDKIGLFTGPIEKGAEVLQNSGSEPVVIRKAFGNGSILQTSFSLGDEPLSTWKGYSSWFGDFLLNADQNQSTYYRNGQDLYEQLYWDFAETNEFFPASNYSVGQLIIIMLVYLIVIVPVLYFVLRRFDKREHSWWIIPSLAIIMSAIVFGLGARDRIAEPQLNQMGVYTLKEGQLSGIQASTLLSNSSGQYKFQVPKSDFQAVPYLRSSNVYDPTSEGVLEEQRKVDEITFKKVGYWSSKTIYGRAQTKTEGGFTVNLSLKNNQLTGTVENGFPFDFEELFIWSGNNKITIGPVKKGETLKVDQKIKQNFLSGPSMLSNNNMYPHQQADLEKMKTERLQYAAFTFLKVGSQQPLLGGITKDEVVDVDLVGKKEKHNNLNLVLAPFTAESDFIGKFSLPTELLNTRVEVVSGNIHEKGINGIPNEMMMEDGEYDYIIQLPKQIKDKKFQLDSVKLQMNGQFIQYSILNRKTGEYLPIQDNQNVFTLNKEDQLEQFFSKDGELLIKVHKNTKGDPYVYLPSITVKGEVTP
jgi:hypothetical protein